MVFALPIGPMSSVERKFLAVGIWNTLFSPFLIYLLNQWAEVFHNYQIPLLVTFLASTLQAHYTQRKFVWKSTGRHSNELLKFHNQNHPSINSKCSQNVTPILLISLCAGAKNVRATRHDSRANT